MTVTPAATPALRHRLMAGHVPFLMRRLHSLTGIVFGGYLVLHLLINASLVEGYRQGAMRTVYQKQVAAIHSLPFLMLTRWVLVYLPIVYHTVYGLWLTYESKPNVNQYPYGKNIFYLIQRVSALLLAVFIVFHVTAMRGWWAQSLRFDAGRATESVIGHMSASWFIGWCVYPVGILVACFHLAHGFWTAGISWGITISAGAQRRWGIICLVIFLFTLVCGMTALVAALTPAALANH